MYLRVSAQFQLLIIRVRYYINDLAIITFKLASHLCMYIADYVPIVLYASIPVKSTSEKK